MQVVYQRCAGIDVHLRFLVVCLSLIEAGVRRKEIRTFRNETADLLALRAWLLQEGCSHVGMESTGVYTPPTMLPKMGSGSLEQDGPLGIVAMKKEEQTGIVHDRGFGKGQCHTDKTSQTLSSCVIPALHMGRFSGLFAHSSVLLFRDHSSIDFQKIREAVSLPIPLRNRFPQPLARLFTPITHGIGNHLSRLAAQGNPHPDLVGFFEHK
jgi:hypothetical protein